MTETTGKKRRLKLERESMSNAQIIYPTMMIITQFRIFPLWNWMITVTQWKISTPPAVLDVLWLCGFSIITGLVWFYFRCADQHVLKIEVGARTKFTPSNSEFWQFIKGSGYTDL